MRHKGTMRTQFSRPVIRALCALCLFPFATSSSTADPFNNGLTLEAALQYGEENSAQLQAVYHQWQSALYNISVQKALPDPMLTYGYYFESVETRVGPQEHQMRLQQKIPGFGKRSALESIASDRADAAHQRYLREKLNLHFSIAQAYAELYYLERSIDITTDRIDLIRALEEVARTRYQTGAPLAPVMQAQVELGRMEDTLNSLNDLRQPLQASLNALLHRSPDAPLRIAQALPYRSVNDDAASLDIHLPRTSPELMELEANVAQGSHQLLLAKRQRLPDFTLGLMYIETGDATMAVSDSGKDPLVGTIGITLPIWFNKNQSRIKAAANLKTAAELSLENRRETLSAEIRRTRFKLRDADRKINLYKQSLIPKARQSLEVNRQSYETGRMEFINLIDAERILLEFELAHERARADHLIARAELTKLTGIDFLKSDASDGVIDKEKE
jgi:outer membrane protein, heavy metal efflux system